MFHCLLALLSLSLLVNIWWWFEVHQTSFGPNLCMWIVEKISEHVSNILWQYIKCSATQYYLLMTYLEICIKKQCATVVTTGPHTLYVQYFYWTGQFVALCESCTLCWQDLECTCLNSIIYTNYLIELNIQSIYLIKTIESRVIMSLIYLYRSICWLTRCPVLKLSWEQNLKSAATVVRAWILR